MNGVYAGGDFKPGHRSRSSTNATANNYTFARVSSCSFPIYLTRYQPGGGVMPGSPERPSSSGSRRAGLPNDDLPSARGSKGRHLGRRARDVWVKKGACTSYLLYV